MASWWRVLQRMKEAYVVNRRGIPDALWQLTLLRYSFLGRLEERDQAALREMATLFLADKEFHGAGGLEVDDQMAVAIAASCSSHNARAISVLTNPGAIELTRTSGANSAAMLRVMCNTAALVTL